MDLMGLKVQPLERLALLAEHVGAPLADVHGLAKLAKEEFGGEFEEEDGFGGNGGGGGLMGLKSLLRWGWRDQDLKPDVTRVREAMKHFVRVESDPECESFLLVLFFFPKFSCLEDVGVVLMLVRILFFA